MKKRRKYIPLKHKLAAALACLLPPEIQDDLRHGDWTVPPETIIRMFEFDHIVLHAWSGPDGWQNLDPKLKIAHREKTRADISRVAKVKRLDAKWRPFTVAMAKGKKPPKVRKSRWLRVS